MITEIDAITVIAKKLPIDGITFREFITQACKLRGDSDGTIEKTILMGEQDGIMEDDIIKIGQCGTRLQ